MRTDDVKVWDIVVRLFHWSLVITFSICYITEDSSQLHIYSGYLIIGLILARLIWGFIGTEYARFTNYMVNISVVFNYLKDIVHNTNKRFIGHNPAGIAMIVVLTVCIIITSLSGVILYALNNNAGPLAFLFTTEHEYLENISEAVHVLFSNISLVLILLHVTGVIIAGKQHNENLIKSMINGYKKKLSVHNSND